MRAAIHSIRCVAGTVRMRGWLVPAPTGRSISAQGNALGSRFIEGPRSEGTPHGSAGAHCAFGAKDGCGVGAEPCSVVCRVDRAVFLRWGYAAFLQNAVLGKGTQGVALGWYVLPLGATDRRWGERRSPRRAVGQGSSSGALEGPAEVGLGPRNSVRSGLSDASQQAAWGARSHFLRPGRSIGWLLPGARLASGVPGQLHPVPCSPAGRRPRRRAPACQVTALALLRRPSSEALPAAHPCRS
jgi:hypothetical protein